MGQGEEVRIGVIGSRSFNDYEMFSKELTKYLSQETIILPVELVSGGAVGTDSMVKRYVMEHKLNDKPVMELIEYLPDYEHWGKEAPLQRNQRIAAESDEMLAFWDGESRGTWYTIVCMVQMGKNVRIISVGGME